MKPAPHRFSTKQAKAAHVLRQRILDGHYLPGTRLREDALADDLEMSPTPVREALRVLASEGLVVSDSHRGTTVVRLSIADVVEIYRIREELEALAASLALSRMGPSARAELAAQLDDNVQQLRRALERGDVTPVPRLNREFHWALYERSESLRLLQLIERLWNSLPHSWLRRIPGRAEWVLAEHAAIVAVLGDDPGSITSALRGHVQRSALSLVACMEAGGSVPSGT